MKDLLKKHWPLLLAVSTFWLLVFMLLCQSLRMTCGKLVYGLDDPYIHMAVAKNFSQHGVWGVTPYEFTSSTSSILWPLILAGIYRVTGPNEVTPFVLNLLLATLVIVQLYLLLGSYVKRSCLMLPVLVVIAAAIPLPVLLFAGMEHVLHISVALGFMFMTSRELSAEKPPYAPWQLPVLSAMLTASRYEGLFLVGITCLLYILRRRPVRALWVGVSAAVPVVIYGAISKAYGWSWLPASVMLKGTHYSFSSVKKLVRFYNVLQMQLDMAPWLYYISIAVIAVLLFRFVRRGWKWHCAQIMAVSFLVSEVFHLCFGAIGWLCRYDAYLVALGLATLVVVLFEPVPGRPLRFDPRAGLVLRALGLLFLAWTLQPMVERAYENSLIVPQATRNIYEQQYQMGLFIREYYQGQGVAMNDIGVVNYLADVRCFDMWGLGSLATYSGIINGSASGPFFRWDQIRSKQLSDVKVAVIYDIFFGRFAPQSWKRVGWWTIRDNVIVGDTTVTFLTAKPSEEKRLIANLEEFSRRLPSDVKRECISR